MLRRHAQLLADAGIDTLIFDTTNAVTYTEVYMKLCEVFRQVREDGGRTPQIAFMVNTQAGKTAQRIYKDLYQPGLYPELWFHWQGKPLMVCDPEKASPELRQFFTRLQLRAREVSLIRGICRQVDWYAGKRYKDGVQDAKSEFNAKPKPGSGS